MQKTNLIVMAKWPAVGRCKSRLAFSIGAKRAAEIQVRLLNHTISVAQALERQGLVQIQLALTGLNAKGTKRWGKKKGVKLIKDQGEGSLGLRMRKQILIGQKRYPKTNSITKSAILIGTDLPGLCELDILQAIESLKERELAIGPSVDGGYWLLGFSGKLLDPVAKWPFSGIPWGTKDVLEKTIAKAKEERVNFKLLHNQNDLDQIIDLKPWQG